MVLVIIRSVVFLLAFAVLAAALPTSTPLAAGSSTAQQSTDPETVRIEKIIRNYLLENPELLVEVMRKLEARQKAAEKKDLVGTIMANRKALFASANDYIANPMGKIPVVEFFDYQCGYCKRFKPSVDRLIKSDKSVRFVFKEFPILGEVSVTASKAALAAKLQGKYLAFHDALMVLRRRLTDAAIYQTAKDVGLDVKRLKKDMTSVIVLRTIKENRALASAMGIRGTPSIVVGEQMAPGAISYEQLLAMIEQARTNCSVC
ncbi:MAG: DsbA family protein [Rhodospirillaceae bacterium]|nr:DsbA family protein [Rhodospirillaceae bacterium]